MSSKTIDEKREDVHVEKLDEDHSVPTEIASDFGDYQQLVKEAKLAHDREAQMTFKQAIKTYPKAVGWSLILSTALIMEGYDTALLGERREWVWNGTASQNANIVSRWVR